MSVLVRTMFGSLWPGLVAWTALYISDYALTLTCARLYRKGAADKIVFEGSFEITPYFQRDIDSLRTISPRFLLALCLSMLYVAVIWWAAALSTPVLYEVVLGILISMELAVHHRHIRNFFLFRAIIRKHPLEGQIRYSRPLLLQMSSVEMFAFAALFTAVFLFTFSWFVLGGAAGCFSVGLKHRRLAHKCKTTMGAAPAMEKQFSQVPG